MKLTEKQREYAEFKRDQHRDRVDSCLSELVDQRSKGAGRTAEKLAWNGDELLRSDHLFSLWQGILDAADDPDNRTTPQTYYEYHLRELRSIEPPSSSGAESHRLNDRARHSALVDFLDDMDGARFGCGDFLTLGTEEVTT